jgi:hypothetical protein
VKPGDVIDRRDEENVFLPGTADPPVMAPGEDGLTVYEPATLPLGEPAHFADLPGAYDALAALLPAANPACSRLPRGH